MSTEVSVRPDSGGSTLNMAGQTWAWLLAKLIADASPLLLVQLGCTCREGRRLAQPDLAYYISYFEMAKNPSIDKCGVCLMKLNKLVSNACVLCGGGVCRDCEFIIPDEPHGLRDMEFNYSIETHRSRMLVIVAGNTMCLMCGWHPGLSTPQLRNYHRWVTAGRLFHELRYLVRELELIGKTRVPRGPHTSGIRVTTSGQYRWSNVRSKSLPRPVAVQRLRPAGPQPVADTGECPMVVGSGALISQEP